MPRLYYRDDLTDRDAMPGPAVIIEDRNHDNRATTAFMARIDPLGSDRATERRWTDQHRRFNDPLFANPPADHVGPADLGRRGAGADAVRVGFSTSTREAGDLSAGVFDLSGAMLAQAVTGTPGHINSMARAVRHFIAKFPVNTMSRGRHLRHQRSVEGHRPPARLHVRDADVLPRQDRRAVRQHLPRGRCRRPRHDGGCGLGLRGRHLHSDSCASHAPAWSMKHWSTSSATMCASRSRSSAISIRLRLATKSAAVVSCTMMDEFAIDDLDRLGRHILEKSREASLEAIRKMQAGRLQIHDAHRRLRQAARPRRDHDHQRDRHRCRFHRDLRAFALRHQRAVLLLRSLFLASA